MHMSSSSKRNSLSLKKPPTASASKQNLAESTKESISLVSP